VNTPDEDTKTLLGNGSWIALLLLPLLFKSALEKLCSALFVFLGSDYQADDIVIIDGRPGRIVRVGITKTTFYLYEVKEGKITGGTKLVIQNERLASLNIEKPLGKITLPTD
jgi:hypothetical protein